MSFTLFCIFHQVMELLGYDIGKRDRMPSREMHSSSEVSLALPHSVVHNLLCSNDSSLFCAAYPLVPAPRSCMLATVIAMWLPGSSPNRTNQQKTWSLNTSSWRTICMAGYRSQATTYHFIEDNSLHHFNYFYLDTTTMYTHTSAPFSFCVEIFIFLNFFVFKFVYSLVHSPQVYNNWLSLRDAIKYTHTHTHKKIMYQL